MGYSKSTKSTFAIPDIVYSKGIDTYVNQGTTVNGLSIEVQRRQIFFATRPHLKNLLIHEENNPLLEEGNYQDPHQRSREGEYYLTHEALTLFIEKNIRNHKTQAKGLVYNSKNIYVFKNDEQNLTQVLRDLDLKINEDAKFIYIMGIHSIPFYIRNDNGKIFCLFVDPESDTPEDLIDLVKKIYPSGRIVLSSTVLQKDFYSCTTFAMKTLLYFVKHGAEIIPYINTVITERNNEYEVLNEQDLMPNLLKMTQSNLQLPAKSLNTIVSYKRQTTLAEYLNQYTITFANKKYNSAALIKKYRYFESLNQYLNKFLGQNTLYNPATYLLFTPLQKIHEMYQRLPQQTQSINTTEVLVELMHYLDEPTNPLSKPAAEYLKAIKEKFPSFEQDYPNTIWGIEWRKDVNKILMIAGYREVQDLTHLDIYFNFSSKLTYLFESFDQVVSYFKKFAQNDIKQPIHDACLFTLPVFERDKWNQSFWASLVVEHGSAVTKYLSSAPDLERLLRQYQSHLEGRSDLERVQYVAEKYLQYSESEKNPQLAALCSSFAYSEEQFIKSLKLVNSGLKPFDFLPEITIKGTDVDPRWSKFTFAKLPVQDLRGLFLGEYTACCQSISKIGENCAIHGMKSPYSGFYVVFENNKIIAQTWAWIGAKGEVVFDSWEFINKPQAYLCKPFIVRAAQELIDTGFTTVLIGNGGNTPKLGLEITDNPVNFPVKEHYSDAKNQYLIKANPTQSMADRFKAFANKNALPYQQYSYLLVEPLDNKFLAEEISRLIAKEQLSFEVFILLIKFFYSNGQEFFHQKTPQVYQLILTAFACYGTRMQDLFYLRNYENKSALDVFMSFDDLQIIQCIINAIGQTQAFSFGISEKIQFNQLAHCAAANDAVNVLTYLFRHNTNVGSWEYFVELKNHQDHTLLLTAAAYKALASAELMLEHFSEGERLGYLLQKQHNNVSILHCLARANALKCFQYVMTKVPRTMLTSLFTMSGFDSLNVNKDDLLKKGEVVLISALFADKPDVCVYLISKGLDFSPVDMPRLVKKASEEKRITALQVLRNAHHHDLYWLDRCIQPFTKALESDSQEVIMFFLGSFKNIDSLHTLLNKKDCNRDFILRSLPEKSKSIDAVLRKLMELYQHNKADLGSILCDLRLFKIIIRTLNFQLIQDLLNYLAQDPEVFEEIVYSTDDKISLLDLLIQMLIYLCETLNISIVNQYIIQFIDILFDISSEQQQKNLLHRLKGTYMSPDVLRHLLMKSDLIDGGKFTQKWLTLDADGPLFQLITTINQNCFPVMIEYYTRYHGHNSIQKQLLVNWDMLQELFIKGHVVLLKYIYPELCTDEYKLKQLFNYFYAKAPGSFTSDAAFSWLAQQKEIPDALILEALTTEKYMATFDSYSYREDYLKIISILWPVCEQRFCTIKLKELIHTLFPDILFRAHSIVGGTYNERCLFRKIVPILESMINYVKEEPNQPFKLLTQTSSNNCSAYDSAFRCSHLGFMLWIFIHCTKEQRLDILSQFDSSVFNNQFAFLNDYLEALDKFEQVVEFKAKLLQQVQTSHNTFFPPIPPNIQELLKLLAPFDFNELYCFDNSNHWRWLTSKEINTNYQKVVPHLPQSTPLLLEPPTLAPS